MNPKIAELLSPYPVISHVPVQWADMDQNQHVNNVIYLKYIEVSRLDFFQKIDFFDFSGKVAGPILAETECKYIYPMSYPDTAWMGSRIKEMTNTDFILETLLVSEKHLRVSAKNESRIVVYDYAQKKKVPMSAEMLEKIQKL
ncbi:MAG: thioesterase family protein [Bacteroidia bacterium]|nr:thioesterase family protein [Bacteroidia bacterium]